MSAATEALTRRLEALQPRTLLAVGDAAEDLLRGYLDAAPGCDLEAVNTEDAGARLLTRESERHYDFCLVAGYLEHADPDQAAAVLARLRDVLTRRLCVLIKGEAKRWPDGELIAYGFSLLARFEVDGEVGRLFGFDLATYKRTPDWLNPRHWAHPEMWGKFRW